MYELALFAGAGGGILGGHLLGWRTVCAVEFDSYAAGVLIARQDDGTLAPFPVWTDIRTFDGRPWAGLVDVISGGFPCQDISCAGKGAGIDGERSGLWGEMFRVVREVGPRFVFVENSPVLTSRGLGRVLGDLASVGYDAEWLVLGAEDVGAPHRRDRIWILANAKKLRCDGSFIHSRGDREGFDIISKSGVCSTGENMADPGEDGCRNAGNPVESGSDTKQRISRTRGWVQKSEGLRTSCVWWKSDPGDSVKPSMGGVVDGLAAGLDIHGTHAGLDLGRVATGVPSRVGRLKAIGNGQVPICAATAFRILHERLNQ